MAIGSRLTPWRSSPSLDENPVLWREWRRGRPTLLARIVWAVYISLALAGTAAGLVAIDAGRTGGPDLLAMVNGLQATFGLLLVSLAAPTVLAEERVRGSLDVLMATPIPTDRIVLGKWWGAFRTVPALVLLPVIGTFLMLLMRPDLAIVRGRFGQSPAPVDNLDRIALVILPAGLLLAQGAAVTSFGLALATWVARIGRAVAISVASFAAFAFGWLVLLEMGVLTDMLTWAGFVDPKAPGSDDFALFLTGSACPLGGQLLPLGP